MVEQIENIITDIYTKIYGRNGLKDVNDIIAHFINEKIDSDENLKGNNILKILANLAVACYDCFQIGRFEGLKLEFGEKVCIGNTIIQDNSDLFEFLRKLEIIKKVFGIE